MVINDTIFTYLTLSTYLQLGQLLPELPNIWPSKFPSLQFSSNLHSFSLIFIHLIMLHTHWLSPLQKMTLHSSKWTTASTSLTQSFTVIDDHLKLKSQYNCEINYVKSNMISFNLTALTQPTLSIQRKSKTRDIFPRKTFQNFTQLSFIVSIFNKNSRFSSKLSSFNHGTKAFQRKSLRRYDHYIPYGRRWRTQGNGVDISLKWWERNQLTPLIAGSAATGQCPRHIQRHHPTHSSATWTDVIVKYLCPTMPNHPANLADLRWWRYRDAHPNRWQSRAILDLHAGPPIHPGNARIPDPRKSWAFWWCSSTVTHSIKQPPQYHHTCRRPTRYDFAPPSPVQRTGNRLLGMRQIVRPSNRWDSGRLPTTHSATGWNSPIQTNKEKSVHRWPPEQCLQFSPPGSVAGCRLWRPSILCQLQWAELRYAGTCFALIWRLKQLKT